jgi:asparagine synthase (glutamine-hydrolysing)
VTERYVVLAWSIDDASVADTARLMRTRAALERLLTWRLVHQRRGLWIFAEGDGLRVQTLAPHDGVLIGDVFDASGQLQNAGIRLDGAGSVTAAARDLVRRVWGRYVALWAPPMGGQTAILRDPMGGLECVTWRLDGVTVVASTLPDALLRHLAPPLAIDWSKVAGFVDNTLRVTGDLALTGLRGVRPGELVVHAAEELTATMLWRPLDFARPGPDAAPPGETLVEAVDRCVGAWARAYPKILAELSGGLDSAIVGSALIRAKTAAPLAWLNAYTDQPQGDERVFADALFARFKIAAIEHVRRAPMIAAPEDFMVLADGPRPTLNGSDAPFDAEIARRAQALGAQALLTGQGGDVVFYELQTTLIAADRLLREGPAGLSPRFVGQVAAWNQVSAWTVVRAALVAAAGLEVRRWRPAPTWLGPAGRRAGRQRLEHVWLKGLRGVAPGKRLQLRQLAYMQVVFGASRRGRDVALIHPLLSQPLVELCLSIPADRLAEGGRGRGLVRLLFGSRLPASVIDRRSKGDMTAFYGHAVAEGLDQIRPFLLKGRLVARRIVDQAALGAALRVEALAHEGRYGDIFDLIAIEAWVRCWEARISALGQAA